MAIFVFSVENSWCEQRGWGQAATTNVSTIVARQGVSTVLSVVYKILPVIYVRSPLCQIDLDISRLPGRSSRPHISRDIV